MNKLIQAWAFILTDHGFDITRLLTFRVIKADATDPYHTYLHIPTGNVEQGQTPEDALYQSIHRQTGISEYDVTLIRKIGISNHYRMHTDTTFIYHEYVLGLNVTYPEIWEHIYEWNDNFSEDLKIQMVTPAQLSQINIVYQNTLTKHLPEFMPPETDE